MFLMQRDMLRYWDSYSKLVMSGWGGVMTKKYGLGVESKALSQEGEDRVMSDTLVSSQVNSERPPRESKVLAKYLVLKERELNLRETDKLSRQAGVYKIFAFTMVLGSMLFGMRYGVAEFLILLVCWGLDAFYLQKENRLIHLCSSVKEVPYLDVLVSDTLLAYYGCLVFALGYILVTRV